MHRVKTEIKFGTDGWRGVIGDDFTFENVKKVAQAIADYYKAKNTNQEIKIVVGYDTRFMSENFAEVLSKVLVDNGIFVLLSDRPIPTPTLSFAVKHRKFTSGVMITASHNPAEYNGIKIKTAAGGAAGVEITKEVEKLILNPKNKQVRKKGQIKKLDLTKDYINFLRKYIKLDKFKKSGFKVLLDPMHGSGASFMLQVLEGTSIKIQTIRQDINPSFDGRRPEPVPENLEPTMERLKKEKFDLGLVLDGDADRIAAFTGEAEFVNPQKILGLLTLHLIEDRGGSGGIVKTIVGTTLIDKISKALKLKLYETPVGFKYISELMLEKDILIGGEEAGGIGFKGYIPERDGTLAGLLLLEMMIFYKKPMHKILQEMESRFGRYYYLRDEAKTTMGQKKFEEFKKIKNIQGKDVVCVKDYDGIKFVLSDESWLMLRASGTEPIVRIYAESKSLARTKRLIDFGKQLIKNDS